MLLPFSGYSIMKMEAAHTCRTLAPIYQSKQCPTTQSCNLNIHCHSISNLNNQAANIICAGTTNTLIRKQNHTAGQQLLKWFYTEVSRSFNNCNSPWTAIHYADGCVHSLPSHWDPLVLWCRCVCAHVRFGVETSETAWPC